MLARLNIHKKNQYENFQRIVFKNLFEVWKYMAKKYEVAFNMTASLSLQEISFLTTTIAIQNSWMLCLQNN